MGSTTLMFLGGLDVLTDALGVEATIALGIVLLGVVLNLFRVKSTAGTAVGAAGSMGFYAMLVVAAIGVFLLVGGSRGWLDVTLSSMMRDLAAFVEMILEVGRDLVIDVLPGVLR